MGVIRRPGRGLRAGRRRSIPRSPRQWGPAERRTLAIGLVAGATTAVTVGLEVARVWRRGSAPLPPAPDALLVAAGEAVTETVEVAVAGYQDVPARENAMFNLLTSFVATFAIARAVTYVLRGRSTFGPLRNLRVRNRHIHHFVPGIVLAFGSGAAAILIRDESLEPHLATSFGVGMGLTLDESALLLELDDVYWSPQGLLSVQITLAVAALLGAVGLAARFLRRGEQLVLPGADEQFDPRPGGHPSDASDEGRPPWRN